MRERAQRRDTKLMLWGIVTLGAASGLVALGAKSFWLDEIASVVIARMPGNSFSHWLWTEEGNMALYYVVLRAPWLEIHLGEATVRLLFSASRRSQPARDVPAGQAAVRTQRRNAGGVVSGSEHLRRGVIRRKPAATAGCCWGRSSRRISLFV